MAKFGELTGNQVEDILNKVNSAGGGNGIKRWQSGELVLVERSIITSSPVGLDNGGVSYASSLNVEAFLDDWAKHLKEVYSVGMPSRKKLALPKVRQGFGWGVVRVRGLSAQRMLNVLKPRFDGKLWQWCPDIDAVLDPTKEARTTVKGPYGVWCRDRVEADEEHKNKSANDLAGLGINCMTEPERIALEGWFHWKTGGHLDIKSVALSAGSRYLDGHVPYAGWGSDDGFYVDRYSIDSYYPDLRAREVVSPVMSLNERH